MISVSLTGYSIDFRFLFDQKDKSRSSEGEGKVKEEK